MTRVPQGEARLEPAGAGQSLRRQLSPPGSLPRPFRGGCSRCQRRPRRSTRSWQGHPVQHLALEARVPRIVWGLPANLGDPAPGMHIARWRRRWGPVSPEPAQDRSRQRPAALYRTGHAVDLCGRWKHILIFQRQEGDRPHREINQTCVLTQENATWKTAALRTVGLPPAQGEGRAWGTQRPPEA